MFSLLCTVQKNKKTFYYMYVLINCLLKDIANFNYETNFEFYFL